MESLLTEFTDAHAQTILGWVRSPPELEAWASRADLKPDAELFRKWHSDRDTYPYVLDMDGDVCAYGEIWEDHEQREAELARIIVAPHRRGRGVGRSFVRLLVDEAIERGFADIWLRVLPWNAPALSCYTRAGFSRATPAQEAVFNRGQPRTYVWLRRPHPSADR